MVPVWRNNRGVITVRFVDTKGHACFAKLCHEPNWEDLECEVERTLWLSRQGIPTVEIIDYMAKGGQQLLISREIEGFPGIAALHSDPQGTLALLGKALASLHSLTVDECPFSYLVQSDSLEDPCVIHGDPAFPNFVIRKDGEVVFLDCGDVGIGDRYIDFAAILKSLSLNGVTDKGAALFNAYGLITPNPARLQAAREIYDAG